jgi:hypothetical protein
MLTVADFISNVFRTLPGMTQDALDALTSLFEDANSTTGSSFSNISGSRSAIRRLARPKT